MKQLTKKRNYNIDFLRGIATLCIVLIHTTWWSGTGYLPNWFSNITLLIDVPVFMFIAGISFNYVNSITKNIKGLLIQWEKWLYFLIFYIIIVLIFFKETFVVKDVLSWIIYIFPTVTKIPVVGGSIWFMLMYIKVTIVCSMIICAINHFCKGKQQEVLTKVLFIMLMIFCYCSHNNQLLFFDSYLSFYSFIYLLGYILHNYKIKNLKQFLLLEGANLVVLILVFVICNLNINDIQNIKFPPSIPYLFFSFISIILFWYLKDNLNIKENNKIIYVGKTAIFFYFSQGISSSFIYYLYPYLPFTNVALKFVCMLITNVCLATIGAIILDKSYNFLKEKFIPNNLKKLFLPVIKDKKEL